jgi:hypothetical protein
MLFLLHSVPVSSAFPFLFASCAGFVRQKRRKKMPPFAFKKRCYLPLFCIKNPARFLSSVASAFSSSSSFFLQKKYFFSLITLVT